MECPSAVLSYRGEALWRWASRDRLTYGNPSCAGIGIIAIGIVLLALGVTFDLSLIIPELVLIGVGFFVRAFHKGYKDDQGRS